jgi:hypothetical protein
LSGIDGPLVDGQHRLGQAGLPLRRVLVGSPVIAPGFERIGVTGGIPSP